MADSAIMMKKSGNDTLVLNSDKTGGVFSMNGFSSDFRKIYINAPNFIQTQAGMFASTTFEEIELNCKFRNAACLAQYNTNVKKVIFNNSMTDSVTTGKHTFMFYGCISLETVIGEIISSDSNPFESTITFYNCVSLKDITFGQNFVRGSQFSLSWSPLLTNASIISASNALNESSPNIFSLHNTVKPKLSTIIGTVAMDSGNTYHIFTEDAQGTTTLQDFITNTKGWTIA